jgi:NAD(P)H-dependent FMN reductase
MSKKVTVILGSVRTERAGKAVADWFLGEASKYQGNLDIEFIDLAELNLPFMDEPIPPGMSGGNYVHDHTKAWSRIVGGSDGFVFITPEYNHGYPPVLKNAIDYLFEEWKGKPVAFVGYGGSGAVLSIGQLLPVVEFLGMKPLDEKVGVSEIWAAFDEDGSLKSENISSDAGELLKALENAIGKETAAA